MKKMITEIMKRYYTDDEQYVRFCDTITPTMVIIKYTCDVSIFQEKTWEELFVNSGTVENIDAFFEEDDEFGVGCYFTKRQVKFLQEKFGILKHIDTTKMAK